jgi:hypothetical protein
VAAPTFKDVLKALGQLGNKLKAEKTAHAATMIALDKYNTVFDAFLGREPWMSAELVTEVRAQLEAHAAKLEGLAVPPSPDRPTQ